jgi:hypothetical protein
MSSRKAYFIDTAVSLNRPASYPMGYKTLTTHSESPRATRSTRLISVTERRHHTLCDTTNDMATIDRLWTPAGTSQIRRDLIPAG